MATKEQEINLLHQALMIDLDLEDAAESRAIQNSLGKNNCEAYADSTTTGAIRKKGVSLSELSGAGKTSYLEYSSK